METKTEGPRRLGFVLSEGNGNISYGTATIALGAGILLPGTVLGAITASGKFVASPNAEVVGIEGASAATCVLATKVDATDADVTDVLVFERLGEVKKDMLVFDASVDDGAKVLAKHTQLAAQDILVR